MRVPGKQKKTVTPQKNKIARGCILSEQVDVLDENGNKTGQVATRKDCHT
jgi:hypothetical protein